MHRSPYTGLVEPGVLYADHGFWDDYHAWYPMLLLLYPERHSEILQGWVNAFKRAAGFRNFHARGYRGGMTGSLIDSVFGDAAAKGVYGIRSGNRVPWPEKARNPAGRTRKRLWTTGA